MIKRLRRKIKKAFRELLIYHNSSLEYRAKLLTLMVAVNNKITPCEEKLLYKIACDIYEKDEERAEILVEAVLEYFNKIVTDNGLAFEHLVFQVEKETKMVKRFAQKINIKQLRLFRRCLHEEEDIIYQERVLAFLERLKEQYGSV